MIGGLVVAVIAGCLALAVAALVWAALDRPVRLGHVIGGAAVEIALLVQAGIAGTQLLTGTHLQETATFVGYLFGSLVVLPVGMLWALEERTRWSSVVLGVASFTVAVIVVRMNVVWGLRG